MEQNKQGESILNKIFLSGAVFGFFFIILLLQFGISPNVSAAVLFETNFDSSADWNANGQYNGNECSVIGASPASNVCPANTYPSGWEAYREACNACNNGLANPHPKVSIQRLPGLLADHTGTGLGKAVIIYNESNPTNGAPWPGDGNLVKYFNGTTYAELYTQFWMRVQPSWHWAPNGASGGMAWPTIKFFRSGYWAGMSAPGQNIFYTPDAHPNYIADMYNAAGTDSLSLSYRCDPTNLSCQGFMDKQNPNSYQYYNEMLSTDKYSDGNWHRWKFHSKMNTAGVSNGTMQIWLDGNLIVNRTNVQWKESGSKAPGFSHVQFGGNSANPWTDLGEQWYAMDDIVVSTSDIPDNYIPGGGSTNSDTTPPAAPTGIKAQ